MTQVLGGMLVGILLASIVWALVLEHAYRKGGADAIAHLAKRSTRARS